MGGGIVAVVGGVISLVSVVVVEPLPAVTGTGRLIGIETKHVVALEIVVDQEPEGARAVLAVAHLDVINVQDVGHL